MACAQGLAYEALQLNWWWGFYIGGQGILQYPSALPTWPIAQFCAERNDALDYYAVVSQGRLADELSNMECAYSADILGSERSSVATGTFAGIHLPPGHCFLFLHENPWEFPDGTFPCSWGGAFSYDLTLDMQAQKAFGNLLGVDPTQVLSLVGDGDLPGSCIKVDTFSEG